MTNTELKSAFRWCAQQPDPHAVLLLIEQEYSTIRNAKIAELKQRNLEPAQIYAALRAEAIYTVWARQTGRELKRKNIDAAAELRHLDEWRATDRTTHARRGAGEGKLTRQLATCSALIVRMRNTGDSWPTIQRYLKSVQGISASVPMIRAAYEKVK